MKISHIGVDVQCPKCGAMAGEVCRNLSTRKLKWQTWTPEPHRERKQLSRKTKAA